MILIKLSSHWFPIPKKIAKCPECGATLFADCDECEVESRKVTRAGLHLSCLNEDEENPDTWHRHWQSDWQEVIDDVYKWMAENVRVSSDAPTPVTADLVCCCDLSDTPDAPADWHDKSCPLYSPSR